ncbi:MAG: VWA domain-containing protein [Lachnospiraceae bacterium]|nr:VWA domain-containing protein [Lachnospiraceae bacterium]MBR1524115.1 VWA domain-containing protein [Lachnospiraceae bacterium]
MKYRLPAVFFAAVLVLTGCGDTLGVGSDSYTREESLKELDAYWKEIKPTEINAPLDIYEDTDESVTLADISTFPIVTEGRGQIDIEVAAATEMSSKAPDDWMVEAAEKFNSSKQEVGGKSVSVSVRKITSGEAVTYIEDGGYRPEVFAPSNSAWGEMLDAEGFRTIKLADRVAGNTAGVLMEKKTYDEFIQKYGEVTVDKVLEASIAGDLTFAYTNPYTSSTGLNILAAMLHSFDPEDPLSDTASGKLLEYQKQSPPVAYTTSVLREQAAKGIIKAMVMEEQAYHNTPELRNYVYTPAGIRHDHPVYTFDYVDTEEQEAAKLFVEYLQTPAIQKLATDKGFNLHDEYKAQDPGLDGAGWTAAQKIWKASKDGGRPIVAVFVADVSGSMDGLPINSLRDSLVASSKYIGSDHYIGLVSYNDNVYIDLPIAQFDATQRAYFSGAVKQLTASGGTATYDAVLVALKMMEDAMEEIPDAKPMLFVLSDGDANRGVNLSRTSKIVGGLDVPVYTIGYNLNGGSAENQLKELSSVNEAALINAGSDDIVNQLRNLFNVQL